MAIWTGGSAGSWHDSGNWNPSGVPGIGDTAIVDTSTTITLSGPIYGLTSLKVRDDVEVVIDVAGYPAEFGFLCVGYETQQYTVHTTTLSFINSYDTTTEVSATLFAAAPVDPDTTVVNIGGGIGNINFTVAQFSAGGGDSSNAMIMVQPGANLILNGTDGGSTLGGTNTAGAIIKISPDTGKPAQLTIEQQLQLVAPDGNPDEYGQATVGITTAFSTESLSTATILLDLNARIDALSRSTSAMITVSDLGALMGWGTVTVPSLVFDGGKAQAVGGQLKIEQPVHGGDVGAGVKVKAGDLIVWNALFEEGIAARCENILDAGFHEGNVPGLVNGLLDAPSKLLVVKYTYSNSPFGGVGFNQTQELTPGQIAGLGLDDGHTWVFKVVHCSCVLVGEEYVVNTDGGEYDACVLLIMDP